MDEGHAPPTVSEWDESDSMGAQPRWPKVVGIISIVWGSLSLLCAGCGTLWVTVGMRAIMPPDQQVPSGIFMTFPQVVHAGVNFLVMIFLIIAGVATLRRRPAGRLLHLVYGALGLVMFTIGMLLAVQQQALMQQWVADNPSHPIAKSMQGAGGKAGQVFGWAIAVILGLAYPLFILIWFGLVKRTAESMGGGASAPEPAA